MKVPSVALSLVFAAGFVQTATVIVQLAGKLTGYQDPLYGWERHYTFSNVIVVALVVFMWNCDQSRWEILQIEVFRFSIDHWHKK